MSRPTMFERIQPIARMMIAPRTSGIAFRNVASAFESDRKMASPHVLIGWVIMRTTSAVQGGRTRQGPGAVPPASALGHCRMAVGDRSRLAGELRRRQAWGFVGVKAVRIASRRASDRIANT